MFESYDLSKKYIVACSGGPDSMALLNMLINHGFNVIVAMVNYKTRLEAGGVKNPGADDRNGLEKLLNLGQNQGLIKDIFEILGRPQQAIFTGIKTWLIESNTSI